ncbi:MAG: hypothetical protein IJH64_07970 [Oscillospiraceae bacterium]|nr:hypothetical protein [Oscillospiraceae bacterium]MBR0452029.1 hypothetical protein [Oscillospiraceae bacterium]
MRRFNTKKVVLVLSALLIVLVGMIAVLRSGITQAALTESEEQTLEITMSELGVSVLENGKTVSGEGSLLSDFKSVSLDPGRTYTDKITVKNSGAYDEYVRVVVKKYWQDSKGKRVNLSPAYICLVTGNGWTENAKEQTTEQSVWYCNNYVAVGAESNPVFTGFYIDSEVFTNREKSVNVGEPENGVIKVTYDYDDLTFVVEIEAQAIQYNSADKAIKSAWGVTNVTASGGTVSVG